MAERNIFDIGGNRAFAALADLIVLVVVSQGLAGLGSGLKYAMPLLAFAYLTVLPMTRLQGTLGMRLGGVQLTDRQGGPLGWRAVAIRAGILVVWLWIPLAIAQLGQDDARFIRLGEYWWSVFFLPWAVGGFRRRRESVFDLLVGAVPSLRGAAPETIAAPPKLDAKQIISAVIAGFFYVGFGVALAAMLEAQRMLDHRVRVEYAMQQVTRVRAAVEDFHAQNHRWPSAEEVGVADWNPYPAGGGYRLLENGVVEITFSVVPDLKGHRISLNPAFSSDLSMEWRCSADADLEPVYLPYSCREGGGRIAAATKTGHCDEPRVAP